MLAAYAHRKEVSRTGLPGAAILSFPASAPPAQPLNVAQDSSIYEEGDDAVCYYRLVSGVVRTCRFSADGRRHIDAFYKPGEVFGIELGAEHHFSAEAVTDCVIIPCRRTSMEEAAALQQLYTYAMQQLERARAHSQLLGRCSAAQRLAAFLLEIAAGRSSGEITLPMTRQDIADFLGLTIETVSRTLAQFEKNGVIRLRAARLIELRNRMGLEELAA